MKCLVKLKYFPPFKLEWSLVNSLFSSQEWSSSTEVLLRMRPKLPLVMLHVLRSNFILLPRVRVKLISRGGGGFGLVGASKYDAITNRFGLFGFCPVSTFSFHRSLVSSIVSVSESVQNSSGWNEWRLSYVLSSEVSSVKG